MAKKAGTLSPLAVRVGARLDQVPRLTYIHELSMAEFNRRDSVHLGRIRRALSELTDYFPGMVRRHYNSLGNDMEKHGYGVQPEHWRSFFVVISAALPSADAEFEASRKAARVC